LSSFERWGTDFLSGSLEVSQDAAQVTDISKGRVTMTTESSKNGAITLSHMNFSGYVGHVTDYI